MIKCKLKFWVKTKIHYNPFLAFQLPTKVSIPFLLHKTINIFTYIYMTDIESKSILGLYNETLALIKKNVQ